MTKNTVIFWPFRKENMKSNCQCTSGTQLANTKEYYNGVKTKKNSDNF